jgi:dolichol-phosphate mannosyltransferase
VAGICADIGMPSAVLEVQNVPRPIGRSHHSFLQRLDLFIDLTMGLSTRPLTVMIHLGLLGCVATAILSLRWIFTYLAYDVPPGLTSVVLVTAFFGCLIVVMLGVIGRYLAAVLDEVRGRPLFLVDEQWNP